MSILNCDVVLASKIEAEKLNSVVNVSNVIKENDVVGYRVSFENNFENLVVAKGTFFVFSINVFKDSNYYFEDIDISYIDESFFRDLENVNKIIKDYIEYEVFTFLDTKIDKALISKEDETYFSSVSKFKKSFYSKFGLYGKALERENFDIKNCSNSYFLKVVRENDKVEYGYPEIYLIYNLVK